MRHARLLLALLAAAIQLPACATTGSPGELRGRSGPVSWEILDITQTVEENGFAMRWDFTLVFKNTGDLVVDFERVEKASRSGGSVDIQGGMSTESYVRTLAPGGELRIHQAEAWTCLRCEPGYLPRFFGDGVIVYYTLFGRDAARAPVRVPVAVRLDSSVGTRQ